MSEERITVKECPFEHKNSKDVRDLDIRSFPDGSGGIMYAVVCKCGAIGPFSCVSREDAACRWGSRDVIILEKKAYEKAKRRIEINRGKIKKKKS
jgi:hypothetical protein